MYKTQLKRFRAGRSEDINSIRLLAILGVSFIITSFLILLWEDLPLFSMAGLAGAYLAWKLLWLLQSLVFFFLYTVCINDDYYLADPPNLGRGCWMLAFAWAGWPFFLGSWICMQFAWRQLKSEDEETSIIAAKAAKYLREATHEERFPEEAVSALEFLCVGHNSVLKVAGMCLEEQQGKIAKFSRKAKTKAAKVLENPRIIRISAKKLTPFMKDKLHVFIQARLEQDGVTYDMGDFDLAMEPWGEFELRVHRSGALARGVNEYRIDEALLASAVRYKGHIKDLLEKGDTDKAIDQVIWSLSRLDEEYFTKEVRQNVAWYFPVAV